MTRAATGRPLAEATGRTLAEATGRNCPWQLLPEINPTVVEISFYRVPLSDGKYLRMIQKYPRFVQVLVGTDGKRDNHIVTQRNDSGLCLSATAARIFRHKQCRLEARRETENPMPFCPVFLPCITVRDLPREMIAIEELLMVRPQRCHFRTDALHEIDVCFRDGNSDEVFHLWLPLPCDQRPALVAGCDWIENGALDESANGRYEHFLHVVLLIPYQIL